MGAGLVPSARRCGGRLAQTEPGSESMCIIRGRLQPAGLPRLR